MWMNQVIVFVILTAARSVLGDGGSRSGEESVRGEAEIKLTQKELDALKGGDAVVSEQVLEQVNLIFQQQLNTTGRDFVGVSEDDVQNTLSLPDFTLASRCTLSAYAKNVRVSGTFPNTNLTTGFYYADGSLNLFLEADIDATMNVNTDLQAVSGFKKWFHSCQHIGRKTVHADLLGRGKILIRAQVSGKLSVVSETESVSTTNSKEEDVQYSIKFPLNFTLSAKPYDWSVDVSSVTRCSVTIAGINFGSYCTTVKNMIMKHIDSYVDRFTQFQAPNLMQKLEQSLSRNVGDTVEFPIEIVNKGCEGKHDKMFAYRELNNLQNTWFWWLLADREEFEWTDDENIEPKI